MNLSENTFGDTPAALYLVRALNELNNPAVGRSVGKRITSNSKCVNELVQAYSEGTMSAKSVANCLRLIRLEVSSGMPEYAFPCPQRLIDQLTRNVQIGLIKRAMRMCTIARKAERVMENPTQRGQVINFTAGSVFGKGIDSVQYSFTDSTSKEQYTAGSLFTYPGYPMVAVTKRFDLNEIKDVTPELLMERSNRRCKRLGKAHTL